MSANNDVPCRVTAETRRHYADLNRAEPIAFDEYDDGIMHDILGCDRLGKPVQALLITLHEIERTMGSFGVDYAKAFNGLLPELQALREACKDEWNDIR